MYILQGVSNTIYGLGLMGFDWSVIDAEFEQTIYDCIIQQFSPPPPMVGGYDNNYSNGNDQSSNNIRQTTTSFSDNRDSKSMTSVGKCQAIANIVYSLGLMNTDWDKVPNLPKKALLNGILENGLNLNPQELSSLCYGLGLMKARYDNLPGSVMDIIEENYVNSLVGFGEQEVCSMLHGYAKVSVVSFNDLIFSKEYMLMISIY